MNTWGQYSYFVVLMLWIELMQLNSLVKHIYPKWVAAVLISFELHRSCSDIGPLLISASNQINPNSPLS